MHHQQGSSTTCLPCASHKPPPGITGGQLGLHKAWPGLSLSAIACGRGNCWSPDYSYPPWSIQSKKSAVWHHCYSWHLPGIDGILLKGIPRGHILLQWCVDGWSLWTGTHGTSLGSSHVVPNSWAPGQEVPVLCTQSRFWVPCQCFGHSSHTSQGEGNL